MSRNFSLTALQMPITALAPLLKKAADAYVAGSTLEEALSVARELATHGTANTMAFWDSSDDTPVKIIEMYLETVRAAADGGLDSYLSIKAPSFEFDAARLYPVLAAARANRVKVHFDSLAPETVDMTFCLIEDSLEVHTDLGCTLPGRWSRSLRDAEIAIRHHLSVRVVKGQWPDLDGEEIDARSGFLNVVRLLAGRAKHVSVATHDPSLARRALDILKKSGTPCELELLYGFPSAGVLRATRDLNIPARFYLPYGHAWLPYALRQAVLKPQVLWWLLRDGLLTRHSRPRAIPARIAQ
jgi:proline dehydrogenase